MNFKKTLIEEKMEFPVDEIRELLEKIKALEEKKNNSTVDGQIVSTMIYFGIQGNINNLRKEVYKIFEKWVKENKLDPESLEVFFHFSAKTGIHKDSKAEFFVLKTKEEDEKICYLLGVVGEEDEGDSSDEEEDIELWVSEEILKDCYPELVSSAFKEKLTD